MTVNANISRLARAKVAFLIANINVHLITLQERTRQRRENMVWFVKTSDN